MICVFRKVICGAMKTELDDSEYWTPGPLGSRTHWTPTQCAVRVLRTRESPSARGRPRVPLEHSTSSPAAACVCMLTRSQCTVYVCPEVRFIAAILKILLLEVSFIIISEYKKAYKSYNPIYLRKKLNKKVVAFPFLL